MNCIICVKYDVRYSLAGIKAINMQEIKSDTDWKINSSANTQCKVQCWSN